MRLERTALAWSAYRRVPVRSISTSSPTPLIIPTKDEGAQLRFEFEAEMARLETD